MATIILTIPDAQLNRVLDAIATRQRYNVATDGTKAQFVKSLLIQWAKEQVKIYEASAAGNIAYQNAANNVDAEIVIT